MSAIRQAGLRRSRLARFLSAVAVCPLVSLALLGVVRPALGYTLSGGGVWDIPNSRRIAFDPSTGAIGNMGTGVVFNVGAPPAAAQAGAVAQATTGFDAWDNLDTLLTRINLVSGGAAGANVPLTWTPVAGTPGETTNAAVNFDPRRIHLDDTRALRTDRWSLDFAGTRPDFIDEYDVYTTTVHEAGHAIGLGHTGTDRVMTPQDTARQNAAGSWRAIEQTAPFAGQPTNLAGGALANGTLAYQDPRAALAADDITGARTLYSAPLSSIVGFFQAVGLRVFRYFYRWSNDSDSDADYFAHEITVPVPPEVMVTDLRLGLPSEIPVDLGSDPGLSQGWQMDRTEAGIRVAIAGLGGLAPGSELDFTFVADADPVMVTPRVRWGMVGLETGPSGGGDGSLFDDPIMTPAFNPRDFDVLGGTFTYTLLGEAWQVVPLSTIPAPGSAPVPEPSTSALLLAGGIALLRWRARLSR